jgi:ubiquinone/menaquinone biosynthesis C-methylase UbiE
MLERYVSDEEYATYFAALNGLRKQIAKDLPLRPGMSILDLATGYGFFSVEIAREHPCVKIVGIDLAPSDLDHARERVANQGLTDRICLVRMDATQMGFTDGGFDAAVNFLGLEDIHMTRGRAGVRKTFLEIARVLKRWGHCCFVGMPPEEMETEAQKIEVELFSYLCGSTWLSSDDYATFLWEAGFHHISKRVYRTGKRLTSAQAKEEIRFACDNVPTIYGVATPSFERVWEQFGRDIERHGLGHYSKVVLFIARKV